MDEHLCQFIVGQRTSNEVELMIAIDRKASHLQVKKEGTARLEENEYSAYL